MADDRRKQIFKAIDAKLKTIAAIKTVYFGSFEPDHAEKPVASIIPEEDSKERVSKPTKGGNLLLAIRLVADKDDENAGWELEDLSPLIDEIMESDKTWGGLTKDTLPQSDKWLYNDAELPQAGMDKWYRVTYER